MSLWSSQLFKKQALAQQADPKVVANAVGIAKEIKAVQADLPPLFTLRHLSFLTQIKYRTLRAYVSRSFYDPYRVFRIRKRPTSKGKKRFRIICVPTPDLLKAQIWISQNILKLIKPHEASVAYSKGNKLIDAAKPHCNCRWLIKMDVQNFFESINEISVYRVFRTLGYQPLIAFELTQLCTRRSPQRRTSRLTPRWEIAYNDDYVKLPYAQHDHWMGNLPQGAPTSPMLANLVSRDFDAAVSKIADQEGLIYTRYADDITLSTTAKDFNRNKAVKIIKTIEKIMRKFGLSANITKTQITPPGGRKMVLGLLVDRDTPHLSREFKATLRQHLHYLTKSGVGPSTHAHKRKFTSITGLKNHLYGLISFAKQIEPLYAAKCMEEYHSIEWPI